MEIFNNLHMLGLTLGEKDIAETRYQDGERDWCELLPDLVLFSLMVPPFQLEVVGPYLIRGT
jgi:hypothetical protein